MQHDNESEIEELMNPKDELKKKIVTLASTMRKWNDDNMKIRKTVRKQLLDIQDLGLNKRKMQKTELRNLITEIFRLHGISDSWIRKLLPMELKDTSKTRISYLQRQQIEKESQRLLQLQQQPGSQQESEIRESKHYNVESLSYQPTEAETSAELEHPSDYHSQNHDTLLSSSESKEPGKVQDELDDAYKNDAYKNKIENLEAELRRLSEQFVARTTLKAYREAFPLIAHVDPVKKEITWIRFEKGSGI